jgi:hypothetical protein
MRFHAFCCILCSTIRESHHHGMLVSRYAFLRTHALVVQGLFRLVARSGCTGTHESEFRRRELTEYMLSIGVMLFGRNKISFLMRFHAF